MTSASDDRREFERIAAGLQHAALDVLARVRKCAWQGLRSLQVLMMAITGLPCQSIDVVTDLADPRAMAERPHVGGAEPAIAAEVLGLLARSSFPLEFQHSLRPSSHAPY